MADCFRDFLDKYDEETKKRFSDVSDLIIRSSDKELKMILWARLPSFYAGSNYIRLIPFKDHINIESKNIVKYRSELQDYELTPKGMIKLFHKQKLPEELFMKIFRGCLE